MIWTFVTKHHIQAGEGCDSKLQETESFSACFDLFYMFQLDPPFVALPSQAKSASDTMIESTPTCSISDLSSVGKLDQICTKEES